MRKSILIGVLAALMLFAFTACDNQVGYKLPVGMTAETSKTEYLVGEKVDPSTIVATVNFSDGTSQTFDGSKLGVSADTMTANAKTINLTYGVGENIATASVTVTGYAVEAIELANLPTEATAAGLIDTSNVTATVEYNNGKTRALAAGEVIVLANASSGTAGKEATATITGIYVFGTPLTISGESAVDVTGDENWTVTLAESDPVTPGTFDPEKFEYEYELVYTDASGKEYDAIPEGAYVDETYTWEIYAVDTDGNRRVAVNGEDYFFVDSTAPAKSITLSVKPAESEATEYAKASFKTRTATGIASAPTTIEYPFGVDYIYEFEKVVVKTGGISTGTASDANYDFYAIMASDKSKAVVTTTGFTAEILDPTVTDKDYAPRFLVSYGKQDADDNYDHVNVLITAEKYTKSV